MPDIAPRGVELQADPGHLLRVGDDGVLASRLAVLRAPRGAVRRDPDDCRRPRAVLVLVLVLLGPVVRGFLDVDGLAVHHLERDLVDVDGMGVTRRVVDLPHLGRTLVGVLGHLLVPLAREDVPALRRGRVPDDDAEQGPRRCVLGCHRHGLDERDAAHPPLVRQGRDRRQDEVLRRGGAVRGHRSAHAELEDLTGRGRIGGLEVAAAEGLVRPDVVQHPFATRDVGEVDDEVGPLGRGEEHLALEVGRHVGGVREQTAVVADLPDVDAGDGGEVEQEEPGLAPVQHPEPVPTLLDVEVRPDPSVDDEGVAEELGVPDR